MDILSGEEEVLKANSKRKVLREEDPIFRS